MFFEIKKGMTTRSFYVIFLKTSEIIATAYLRVSEFLIYVNTKVH